jgi:hypothetical protein
LHNDTHFAPVSTLRSLPSLALFGALALLAPGCSVYDPGLSTDEGRAHGTAGEQANMARPPSGDGDDAGIHDCDGKTEGSCARAHAQGACVQGRCVLVSCEGAFADCDELADNGCEGQLDSPENCGLCKAACRFSHAAGSCKDARCTLGACEPGFDDCDGDLNNGCERAVDNAHDCGACNHGCEKPAHAAAGCIDGSCGVGACDPGFGDCNHVLQDGCEEPLTSAQHCGACGHGCKLEHASESSCTNAECAVVKCEAGYADCNGRAADGCEARLDTADDCGACGFACELPHVERTRCASEGDKPSCRIDHSCPEGEKNCGLTNVRGCEAGWSDCDGMDENGCETDLTRVSSCGACGVSCVSASTLSECRSGMCFATGCANGYGRCDGGTSCRSLLDDPNNCGMCGRRCSGQTPNCAGGQCTDQMCAGGTADCDGRAQNACETQLGDAQSCGACGRRCGMLAHARSNCSDQRCAIDRCDAGWQDCDGDPYNGCEVNVNESASDCGACRSPCALPHAQSVCQQGKCQIGSCDAGRGDCNHAAADGCEIDLKLPDNCGSCGTSCLRLPDVLASSCGGEGCELTCRGGRANCDGKVDTGCESDLRDAHSCGSCGSDCTKLANVAQASCGEGGCVMQQCTPGFADCNQSAADGCEKSLKTASDCGACNQPCALAHATGDCSTGQCRKGACDAGFGDCDGDPSNGCEAALSSPENCGACNTVCPAGGSCQNGACGCTADADCRTGTSCCSGRCVPTNGMCYPWPCIPGTDQGQNRADCGGCGMLCIGWCCGPLL